MNQVKMPEPNLPVEKPEDPRTPTVRSLSQYPFWKRCAGFAWGTFLLGIVVGVAALVLFGMSFGGY